MNSFAASLSKHTAEQYVRYQRILVMPDFLPAPLFEQKACYITVFENPGKHIRAVFGRPSPSQPTLAEEIVVNTIEAVHQRERAHIRQADLPSLGYSVTVLGPLERVLGKSRLDPKRFGLYVMSDRGKSAIILPQRTGIETGEEQISTAIREATINTPQEAITMYRFGVTHYD